MKFPNKPTCLAINFALSQLSSAGDVKPKNYDIKEGDIVFSSSAAGQGEAIIAATRSPYTHCGIVFTEGGKMMVLEAVQPVGTCTLAEFMNRSDPGTFAAKRLKTPMPPDRYREAKAWGNRQIGKTYDSKFLWNDSQIYCSELVWKIYDHGGVQLCNPRKFRDLNLNAPSVKRIIEERYGSMENLPLNEKIVPPSDLAASHLLEEVPIKP